MLKKLVYAVAGILNAIVYVRCAVCDGRFVRHTGGGVSKDIVCSDACFKKAWLEWIRS